jgi:hypothetical protein
MLLACACGGGTEPADSGDPGGELPDPPAIVEVTVNTAQRTPISPFIYGSNQDDGSDVWTVRRYGGNRITGYNWENNFSNAGNDYRHQSDTYLTDDPKIPASEASIPARALTWFHDQSLAMGAESIVSVQMAGYAARDANGPVSVSETAPSPRWVKVEPRKGAAFVSTPDLDDGVVYMDEMVADLVKRYGPASSPNGIRWYSLDNEPALWASTHPRIHPNPVGANELVERSVALASAVKDVDPGAGILGPALYGMAAFVTLQDAPDWAAVRGGSGWFVDYYLDRMREAEQQSGRRLLDLLDVHWYPEARGDRRIVDADANSARDAAARMQAPRSLWDASYQEESWIHDALPQFLPLLPRLRASIDQHYPGTLLSISEYDYGGGSEISGGIAQADVLGIFGRDGVYLATIWGISEEDSYTSAAFKLYRDYDGKGGHFGSTGVAAASADPAKSSAYASIEGEDAGSLHLILLNKDAAALTFRIHVAGRSYASGQAWGFDASSPRITARAGIASITGDTFDYTVAPLSAVHLLLH